MISIITIILPQDNGETMIITIPCETDVLYNFVNDNKNYVVNTCGKVYHVKYKDGQCRLDKTSLKQSKNRSKKGYNIVYLYENGKRKKWQVSRLVADTFIPNPENKPEVHHKNGNSLNDRLDNLQRVTKEEHEELHRQKRAAEKEQAKNNANQ